MGPVAEALAAVHGRGLVHGSVTPDNILFTQDGRPLLSDTALNQVTAGDEGFGGTHGFTDPQVSSTGSLSAAGDVFGLAAVGWTALTGSAPAATARPALLSLSPGIPPGLAHAIEAGLQEDPNFARRGPTRRHGLRGRESAPVRFPVGLVLHDGAAVTGIAHALASAEAHRDRPKGGGPMRGDRPPAARGEDGTPSRSATSGARIGGSHPSLSG